jgi:hypothetical protein
MGRHLRIGEKQRVAGLAIDDLLEPDGQHEDRPNPARPYDAHVWGDVAAVSSARRLGKSAVDVKQRKAREILAV